MSVRMKSVARAAVCRTRAARLSRRFWKSHNALILTYHSISSREHNNKMYVLPGVAVDPAVFERHVDFLAKCYNVVSMDDIAKHIRERRPFEPRTVAITFDDGYADNYHHAFVILSKYGLTATFYITTGALNGAAPLWMSRVRYHLFSTKLHEIELTSMGRRFRLSSESRIETAYAEIATVAKSTDCADRDAIVEELVTKSGVEEGHFLEHVSLSPEHLREMHAAGMCIGGHTVTHPGLPAAGAERVRTEITACTEHLKETIGETPHHFSYPNGRAGTLINDNAVACVRDCGYLTATTSVQGAARYTDDPFTLRRKSVPNRVRTQGDLEFLLERARLFSRR